MIAVVGRVDPDATFLSELKTKLEAVADDVNGDGKVKVKLKASGLRWITMGRTPPCAS